MLGILVQWLRMNDIINVYANSFQLCWRISEGRPEGQTLPLNALKA